MDDTDKLNVSFPSMIIPVMFSDATASSNISESEQIQFGMDTQ